MADAISSAWEAGEDLYKSIRGSTKTSMSAVGLLPPTKLPGVAVTNVSPTPTVTVKQINPNEDVRRRMLLALKQRRSLATQSFANQPMTLNTKLGT